MLTLRLERAWQVLKLNSTERQDVVQWDFITAINTRYIKLLSLASLASYITSGCVLCYTLRTQASDFLHPSSEKQRSRLLIFPERFSPDKPTTNWPRLIMTGNRFFPRWASACLETSGWPGIGITSSRVYENWITLQPLIFHQRLPIALNCATLLDVACRMEPSAISGKSTTPGLIVAIPWLGSF